MWPCQLSFGWCGGKGCDLAEGPLLTCVKREHRSSSSVHWQCQTGPGQECGQLLFPFSHWALGQRQRSLGQRSGWALIGFQLRHWLNHRLSGGWTCLSARQYSWPEPPPTSPSDPPSRCRTYSSPSLWTWLFRSLTTALPLCLLEFAYL